MPFGGNPGLYGAREYSFRRVLEGGSSEGAEELFPHFGTVSVPIRYRKCEGENYLTGDFLKDTLNFNVPVFFFLFLR